MAAIVERIYRFARTLLLIIGILLLTLGLVLLITSWQEHAANATPATMRSVLFSIMIIALPLTGYFSWRSIYQFHIAKKGYDVPDSPFKTLITFLLAGGSILILLTASIIFILSF